MLLSYKSLFILSILSIIYSVYGFISNYPNIGPHLGILILSLIILILSTGILSLKRIEQDDIVKNKGELK